MINLNDMGVRGTTPHLTSTERSEGKDLKYIESKFLYLNTKNRSSGTIGNALITFPNRLFYNSTMKKQILKINLQSINILKDWHDINSLCNELEVNGTPIFIQESSPTVYELLALLNIALSGNYVVSFNVISSTFTFTASNPLNTIKPINSGHFLGLIDGTTYTGTFDSVRIINIQWENSLFVCMDSAVNGNTLDNIINNGIAVSPIIANIPINVSTSQTITWNSFKNKNESVELATLNGLDSATFSIYTNRRKLEPDHDYTFCIKIEHYNVE
jgi:hypothetical protein